MVKLLLAMACLPDVLGVLGAEERGKAADWPAHVALDKAAVGAEYLVHSLMGGGDNLFVGDYLVVEVGFYPAKGQRLLVAHSHFSLRMNGKKSLLLPQSPGMVAASVKYEDWERRPRLEAEGGVGDTGVILGRPRRTERFPGDPRPGQERLPRPPQAPGQEDRSGVEKAAPKTPNEIIGETALVEGDTSGPVRGFLYFAYRGKISSIKKLELLYSGPAGDAQIALHP